MRKIALTLICALLLAQVGAAAEQAPGNRLGLAALAELAKAGENQFVSPVSLAYALAMAAEGAEGETRAQLLAAIEAENPEVVAALNEDLGSAGLRWANAAFVSAEIALLPDYAETLSARYDGEVFPLDAPERVNAWVAAHTDGMIDYLLDDIDPNLRLMLANAVVMDAEWVNPFDTEDTWEDAFYARDGEREVEFMHQTLFAPYGEADGAQFIRLDYRDTDLAMYVALPPEGGIERALADLAEAGLDYFRLSDSTEVWLSLPKLDVTVSNSLSDPLMTAGVLRAFSDDAEFPGISDSPLKIGDVFQKARVQMDEERTRAAAVTAIFSMGAMAPATDEPLPIPMAVNRPYLVVIADRATGAICFAGVVEDPTA